MSNKKSNKGRRSMMMTRETAKDLLKGRLLATINAWPAWVVHHFGMMTVGALTGAITEQGDDELADRAYPDHRPCPNLRENTEYQVRVALIELEQEGLVLLNGNEVQVLASAPAKRFNQLHVIGLDAGHYLEVA